MAQATLHVIKKLQRGGVSQEELEEIYRLNKNEYRVLLHLAQHPRFPQSLSLGILSKLFAVDLVRVIKNVKANPYIRKKAELEFAQRYKRLALGEKISLLKMAPHSLLLTFSEEKQTQLIQTILQNSNCSEEVVMRFVNRSSERCNFYAALDATQWHQNPTVAEAIAHDSEAPIKILLKIIPYLGLSGLQKLFRDETTHQSVRDHIKIFLERRHDVATRKPFD
jgi:hypothetical protein